MIDTDKLSKILTERFGLDILATSRIIDNGELIKIVPTDLEQTISFYIEFLLGWRRLDATFKPGTYASRLVREMGHAPDDLKAAFTSFAKSLITKGAHLKLIINDVTSDIIDPTSWPANWSGFNLSMIKTGVLIENGIDRNFDETLPWITGFFGLSISLLPLESIEHLPPNGHAEGEVEYLISKRYERSKINRAICIELHGPICQVCELNFNDAYGNIGEGFIHVHHVNLLSNQGGSKIINPETDLIPVCPNCHAMLHRTNPPYSIKDLREIISKNKRFLS
ncbi:MAG: HNH endonuclease [Saprospiraceae bacterium]